MKEPGFLWEYSFCGLKMQLLIKLRKQILFPEYEQSHKPHKADAAAKDTEPVKVGNMEQDQDKRQQPQKSGQYVVYHVFFHRQLLQLGNNDNGGLDGQIDAGQDIIYGPGVPAGAQIPNNTHNRKNQHLPDSVFQKVVAFEKAHGQSAPHAQGAADDKNRPVAFGSKDDICH